MTFSLGRRFQLQSFDPILIDYVFISSTGYTEAVFTMSIRGRSKLVLGGHEYSKYYVKKDITHWRCIDLKHCRAKATSQPMGLKHMAKSYGVHTCSWFEKTPKNGNS